MKEDFLKYSPPVDQEGNPYWVPVVAKNKDYLIGYLDGMHIIMEVNQMKFSEMSISLGSDRLNDILPDGRRIGKITEKEFKNHLKGIVLSTKEKYLLSENHDGFKSAILDEYFLTIECLCGNFYGFKHAKELPDKSFKCDICDRLLIDYTEHDDEEYEYDGDPGNVETLVEELNRELNIEDDEDEF